MQRFKDNYEALRMSDENSISILPSNTKIASRNVNFPPKATIDGMSVSFSRRSSKLFQRARSMSAWSTSSRNSNRFDER